MINLNRDAFNIVVILQILPLLPCKAEVIFSGTVHTHSVIEAALGYMVRENLISIDGDGVIHERSKFPR